ncbi:hypothetical protein [Streptomyces odontomachi]|uniref:hypothetical protein n=1 Tax=Streptomyces odontomachi TaxID=2944940 RepID=UPI0021090B7B|nr:hypothetical protein [Streptomyces sp. ODS25]
MTVDIFQWSKPAPVEPDLKPRQSAVMAEPATVKACRLDYEDAPDVRARLDKQLHH